MAPTPEVNASPLLLSNWGCPYVARVSLALVHKGQKLSPKLNNSAGENNTVRELEINLQDKPSWLTQYSPLGKVPAITYKEGDKERVLYESLALIQWVDEFYDGPALLPSSPADRVLARIIIARFDGNAIPNFYQGLRAPSKEAFAEIYGKLHAELSWLEEHIDPKGPFLLGAKPSLVDAAIAPWLLRAAILKHWRNVDILAAHPRLAAYTKNYRQHPDVASVLRTPDGQTGYDAWAAEIIKPAGRWAGEQLDYSDVVVQAK